MSKKVLLKSKEPQSIWNPLKDLYYDYGIGYDPFDFNLENKKINKEFVESFGANLTRNLDLRREYSYAIPSDSIGTAIKTICNSDVVEIGAGLGYWAKYLEQFDINVVAFDPKGNHRSGYFTIENEYHKVLEGGVEQVTLHSDKALMLCWPPYDDPMAYEALVLYKGNYLIYIGESSYGCTGDHAFFNLLEDEWELVHHNRDVMNWWGIHSAEFIYKRKNTFGENSGTEEIY